MFCGKQHATLPFQVEINVLQYAYFEYVATNLAGGRKKKIADLLPDNFSVILDGYKYESTQYTAVFTTSTAKSSHQFKKLMLRTSHVPEETSKDAVEHNSFMLLIFQYSIKTRTV